MSKMFNSKGKKVLRYPTDIADDYIILTCHRYKSAVSRLSQGTAVDPSVDVAGPPIGPAIYLPIPNLPNMVSMQSYGAISGAMNNAVASGLGVAFDEVVRTLGGGQSGSIDAMASRLRNAVSDEGSAAMQEFAAGIGGKFAGLNSAQFQTFARGEISNPLIELLYSGPTLRSYSFNWTLSPKSKREADDIKEIINFIKVNHLPKKKGGMLVVPNVWKIHVFVQGKHSTEYQKYFTAAIEGMSVQQDAAGGHITTPDGAPIATNLVLTFKEMRVVTADDYSDGNI